MASDSGSRWMRQQSSSKELYLEEKRERALLVGVDTGEEVDFDRMMEELKSLAEACNMEVVGIIAQKLDVINKGLYIGTGKVQEVKEYAAECEAQIIIFDNALSPSQLRNLQKELELPILDRTTLILDIFAIRARTKEAKLQVETARLGYLLPRLVGLHEALSRQGGGSGSMSNKGAGETKLELDRRKIEHRIAMLRKELDEVEKERGVQRKKRMNSRTPQVALVGYTNAGKSTVMNRLLSLYGGSEEKQVFEQNMLFATLETSVRNIDTGDNKPLFLVDTVGFIHKLPHGLVKAFHSTLEEVQYADLLVQVVDFSDPMYKQQMEVTKETLTQIGAGDIPMVYVYNKCDCMDIVIPKVNEDHIYMAAGPGIGLEELVALIKQKVYADSIDAEFLIPYDKGNVVSYFMENSTVKETDYREGGVYLHVNCHKQDADKYKEYITN